MKKKTILLIVMLFLMLLFQPKSHSSVKAEAVNTLKVEETRPRALVSNK